MTYGDRKPCEQISRHSSDCKCCVTWVSECVQTPADNWKTLYTILNISESELILPVPMLSICLLITRVSPSNESSLSLRAVSLSTINLSGVRLASWYHYIPRLSSPVSHPSLLSPSQLSPQPTQPSSRCQSKSCKNLGLRINFYISAASSIPRPVQTESISRNEKLCIECLCSAAN